MRSMPSPFHVGVINPWLQRISKRDLLLFDQVVLANYSDESVFAGMASGWTPQERAALEWLGDQGFVRGISSQDAWAQSMTPGLQRHLNVAGIFMMLRDNLKPFDAETGKLIELLSAFGQNHFFEHALRLTALHLEGREVLHATPLFRDRINSLTGTFLTHAGDFELLLAGLEDHAESERVNFPASSVSWLELAQNALSKLIDEGEGEIDSPRLTDAVEIVMERLPVPGESVAWEQMIDFLQDEDTKLRRHELRRWLCRIATTAARPIEVAEELEYLLARYRDHIRFHRMKVHHGTVRTVISSSAEALEGVVRLRFGKVADALFKVREQKVALLEAERTAPGREVAYIVKAENTFAT